MTNLHSIPGRTKKLPPLRVGVGGPVGSGKTTLVEMLCKAMRERWDLIVITNDIYTKEDQRLLTVAGALAPERIMGVETGGCPHTAIREDASINLSLVQCEQGDTAEPDAPEKTRTLPQSTALASSRMALSSCSSRGKSLRLRRISSAVGRSIGNAVRAAC